MALVIKKSNHGDTVEGFQKEVRQFISYHGYAGQVEYFVCVFKMERNW